MTARRIGWFVLVLTLTLAAGMTLPRQWIKPVLNYGGYYFILTAFVLWGTLLVRSLYGRAGALIKAHYPALLLSAVLMSLIFHFSPPQFKILADETNLVGVSMAMHQDKTLSVPLQGLALDYADYDYTGDLDQRPFGYPFFVSLCHALLGYSPYNGFVLNFTAGMLTLFFIYFLLAKAFSRYYGLLGMLLTAACPVFVFWSTSSGFEVFNLCLVVFVLVTAYRFLMFRRAEAAEILFLSLVLLAYCRYESAVFIIGLAVLIPFFANRRMIVQYRLPTFLCPILLLPLFWQRRLSSFSPNVFYGDVRHHTDQLFGLGNLADHFASNMTVLFGLDSRYGFLPVVFALAAVGLYGILKRLVLPADRPAGPARAVIVYGLVCAVSLFLLYSSFYWGDFRTGMDNRLALVLLPFLIVPAVYAVHRQLEKQSPVWKAAVVFMAVVQIVHYWPVAEKQAILQGNPLTYEYNRVLDYIRTNYDPGREKLLVISDRANFYTINGMGSVGFDYARRHVRQLRLLKRIYYDQLLVLQRPNPRTGETPPVQRLPEDYRLRPLKKIPIGPDYCVRISAADIP